MQTTEGPGPGFQLTAITRSTKAEEGGSLGFRPPRTRTGSALRPHHGQTGMPSWVLAAGVPDPENVEPTKMPHEPAE